MTYIAAALLLAQGVGPELKKELAEIRKDLKATTALLAKKKFEDADRALFDVELRLVRWSDAAGLSFRDPGLAADVKSLRELQKAADAGLKVGPPPAELKLAPFYKKHVDFRGFPLVASEKVPDAALLRARAVVREMLAKRPEMLEPLLKLRLKAAIMAKTEVTTDIPEHANLTPKEHWDKRARGLGGAGPEGAVSGAEENLLNLPEDRYKGENIFLHEFAHTIHIAALEALEPGFDARLQALFEAARKKGLWDKTYAAENHKEYWAEGVQSWFDANMEASSPNGIHNGVNTRKELESYDPELAALIRKVFP